MGVKCFTLGFVCHEPVLISIVHNVDLFSRPLYILLYVVFLTALRLQWNENYVVPLLKLLGVDCAALDGVNPRGVHAGVAENIRQPGRVFSRCSTAGEQMVQIVGKHLARPIPALSQRTFMSRQMLLRSMGLSDRVTNTAPAVFFAF